MITYSISEYFRLMLERDELLKQVKAPGGSKKAKEIFLQELRKLDKQLDIDSGAYNSSDFGKVKK